jgi:regulator of sigma E protease
MAILQVVLGIGFLIFIHEAGHYLCARLARIRVEVFSLGFGPRLFGFRRGGTDYRIALVPLGGYVRVAGDEPGHPGLVQDGDLGSRSLAARMMFFSGGVAMNVLFALVAFPLVFRSGVEFVAPVLGEIAEGGPAWRAGLREDDRIRSVDGKDMYSFQNMVVEVALAGRRSVQLGVERGGHRFFVDVQPDYDPQLGVYSMGVSTPLAPEPPTLEVEVGSVAWQAGLREGDELVALGGVPVDARTVADRLHTASRAGTTVGVTVRRNGAPRTVEYVPPPLATPMLGVERAARRVAGLRPGFAALERLGLRPGDHIVRVDGQPFAGGSLAPFATGPDTLTMTVEREHEGSRSLSTVVTPAERAALAEHVGFGTDRIGIVLVPGPDTPAQRAGVLPADAVVRIDGQPAADWAELREAVAAAGDRGLTLTVQRAGTEFDLHVLPARYGDLGFAAQSRQLAELYRVDSALGAIHAGMVCSIDLIKQLYVTLKKLFTGEVAARNLGGIITIGRVSYIYAESGWARFIYFLALLSLNLAFINVLPIPVLDGGHLLFLAIEGIKGSPVSPRVLTYSQIFGLVFVLALVVFVTYNDILRLL